MKISFKFALYLPPTVVIFFCNLGTKVRSISTEFFLYNIYWRTKFISQLERSFYPSNEVIRVSPGLESTESQVYPKRQRRMISAEDNIPVSQKQREDVMSLLLAYSISWSSLDQLRCTADTKCSPSTMDNSFCHSLFFLSAYSMTLHRTHLSFFLSFCISHFAYCAFSASCFQREKLTQTMYK